MKNNLTLVKVCKICRQEKPLNEFYFRKDRNIYRTECKQCLYEKRKPYLQSWYLENQERLHEKHVREYPQQRAYFQNYNKEHSEQRKENNRVYGRNKRRNYCKKDEIELVENYEKAKADNFKGWVRHHRLETHTPDGTLRECFISQNILKAVNLYYDRPAKELIWLTNEDHAKLHFTKPNLPN